MRKRAPSQHVLSVSNLASLGVALELPSACGNRSAQSTAVLRQGNSSDEDHPGETSCVEWMGRLRAMNDDLVHRLKADDTDATTPTAETTATKKWPT